MIVKTQMLTDKRYKGIAAAIVLGIVLVLFPVTLSFYGSLSLTPLVAYAADTLGNIGILLGNFLLLIGAGFAWAGGSLFEVAYNELVLGMGQLIVKDTGIGFAVNNIWIIVRDASNLIFIFGFVYIGLYTILDPDRAGTKRFLAQLVIAALLINFSLFFTKVVIDVSNTFAVEISNLISGGGTQNIGLEIAKQAGLMGLYEPLKAEEIAKMTSGGTFFFFLMGFVFLLILAFVLASAAIMLITRFVTLVTIMIFSPLMFALIVFPQTAGQAKKIFSKLLSAAFFAPVFLFLIYIALRILQAFTAKLGTGSDKALNNAILNGTNDGYSSFLQFTIAIMFVIAALKTAQHLSIAGADQAVKVGNNLRGRAQRLVGSTTFGAAALIGRSSAGRYGNYLANNETLRDKAATSWRARQALKLGNVAAKASFDARRVAGAGKTLNIGEGTKGGYAGRVAATKKREEEFMKQLGTVSDDDTRVQARKSEIDDTEQFIRDKRREREGTSGQERRDLTGEIQEAEKRLKSAREALEQEKNRRQMGSSFDTSDIHSAIIRAEFQMGNAKKRLGDALKRYLAAKTDAERKAVDVEVQELSKAVAQSKTELKNAKRMVGSEQGYIDVIGRRGLFTSLPTRANRGINRTIATELANAYKKKVKKSKEDKANDAVVDAVKGSGDK